MQEFQNEKVRFEVHYKPQCVVEYDVHVLLPLIEEAHKEALRVVAKKVVLPGFRKGKAPSEVVAKRFPDDLDKSFQQAIAESSYRECSALARIPLLKADTKVIFIMHTHSREGAHVTLSFETVPQVPEIDPAQFVLKEVEYPHVSSERVAEAIRQTQFFFATWTSIANRPVQEGDYLLLDVENIETTPPSSVFVNTRFEVSDLHMAKWMKDLVLGKQSGESIEGLSFPDPDLPEEKKAEFQPRRVRVSIKAIQQVELPPIDEQFVKQLGLQKVEELEPRVSAILTQMAENHVKQQQRQQVTDFLLTIQFELPRSVIEKEAQFRLEQMMKEEGFRKKWEVSSETERRSCISQVLGEADRAIRIFYLCRALILKEKLSITAKDLHALPADQLSVMLNPDSHMQDFTVPEFKQAESYSRLMLEKTADWVLLQMGQEQKLKN